MGGKRAEQQIALPGRVEVPSAIPASMMPTQKTYGESEIYSRLNG